MDHNICSSSSAVFIEPEDKTISFPPDYLKIIDKNEFSIHGYLIDLSKLNELLELHKIFTKAAFLIKFKTGYVKTNHRIFGGKFLTENNTLRMRIKHDIYRCRYGRRGSQDNSMEESYGNSTVANESIPETFLKGCPAMLHISEYIIFPELLNEGSKTKIIEMKQQIRNSASMNFNNLTTIRYIEVNLPLTRAHQNHTLKQQDIQNRSLTGLIKRKVRCDKGSNRSKKLSSKFGETLQEETFKIEPFTSISTDVMKDEHKVVMASLVEEDEELVLFSLTATNKIVHIFSIIPNLFEAVQSSLPDVNVERINFMQDSDTKSREIVLLKEELDQLKEAEVLLIDNDLYALFVDELPRMKWVQGTDIGVDSLVKNLKPSQYPNYLFTKSLGEDYCNMMTEYVIGWIIHHDRDFFNEKILQKQKKISSNKLTSKLRGLSNLKISILGLGAVGRSIAKMLHTFGSHVIGYAKTEPPDASDYLSNFYFPVNLLDLLEHTDVIVNTLPSTSSTENLLGNNTLQVAKNQPLFINIGNTSIIKESCLLNCIHLKWISKAILDLHESDFIPKSSNLRTNNKVIITPRLSQINRVNDISSSFATNWYRLSENIPLIGSINWLEQH